MPESISHKHHDAIAKDGFVVIKGFLTPEEVEKYKAASVKVVDYAREGKWSAVRTVGKQFPPWPKNYSPDIWGVSGLLHPDLGDLSLPFHDCYASDKILDVASDILQVDHSKLSMELFNMLINPLTDFELDWHRDTIKPEVTPEEEADQLLLDPYAGTQFNLALTNDDCLIVVPASHNRIRTEKERETTINDKTGHIDGQIFVHLSPGDIVFYNNNILHRAKYSSKNVRLTLHGSYGSVEHGKSRAKGILQHGVATWLPRFETKNDNLNMMKSKLENLAKEFEGVDLGYALSG
jgi:alpha-ketoglutarate-dependent taurine dioxygenase